MKDLALSLLSRGYSQEVQTHDGGPYRRLEIFFEPEDYFNWRSQPPLLRLSSSGRLLGGAEPTPPKTYSTRRGPLILYSEDLALSSCQTSKLNRKGRALRSSREEAEIQLHTLQDLTEAILAYGKKQPQAKVGCHTSVTQPLLPVLRCATLRFYSQHTPAEEQDHVNQLTGRDDAAVCSGQGNSVNTRPGQERYRPRFLCFPQPQKPPSGPLPPITHSLAPRHSEDRPHLAPGGTVTSKTKGPEDQTTNKEIKTTFRTAVKRQRVQMSPITEAESRAREELRGWTVEQTVTEHLTGYPKDESGQWKQSAIETGGEKESSSSKPANINPSLGCSHLSSVSNFTRHVEAACQRSPVKQKATDAHLRKTNTHPKPSFNTFHLPPINQTLPSDSDSKEHEVNSGGNTRDNHKDSVPQLPDIHHTDRKTETTAPKPPERCVLRNVLLLLPSQMNQDETFPQKSYDGHHGLPEDEKEREDGLPEKKDVLSGGVEQKGESLMRGGQKEPPEHGCLLHPAEHYNLIWFEPVEDKENQTIPGPLPPFIGRKGPGKQSSMALYRQDPGETADQTEPRSGIIRGSLPLELRECEKGEHCGTLIMGPAGEIIRLSLWDALTDTEDHPVLDEATREHVLRVMTSEGVGEQPWAILLKEQKSTYTDRMNKGELEAHPGRRQQANSNQEERPTAEHTGAVENAERFDADGKRMVEACASEQRPGKLKRSIETRPAHSKGENAELKSSGRTQALQPEGGDTPGSSIPNSTSASSPQKKALSISTAVQEAELQTQTNRKIETDFDSKTQSRKAGGGDDAESTQIRKVKKKEGKLDQHVEKKTGQTNEDRESEDTIYTADPSPGPTPKKKKTTKKPEETTSQPKKTSTQPKKTSTQPKKSRDSRSQPKDYRSQTPESRSQTPESRSQTPESRSQTPESRSQTPESRSQTPESRSQTPESRSRSKESRSRSKESRRRSKESRRRSKESRSQARDPKSQPKESRSQSKEYRSQPNNTIKKKKKTKGQAAFVVGKPRKSQAEREADIPGRPERTAPSREENDPEHQAELDRCCSTHGPAADIDQASVYRDDRTAAGSLRTLSSAAASSRSHGSTLASSRPHSSAAASNRTHGSAAPSRTYSPAAYSYRTHSPAATSTRTHSSSSYSYRTHSPTAASTRTHSSTAMYSARERPWRTNKATKIKTCTPAPLSLTQMPSQSAHHSPSNPAKPGSNGHSKSPDEAAVLREIQAAAKAEKAERRRLETERKRKEKEEEQRREEKREEREEKMKLELEEEQRQRAEQAR
uniref:Uncharacterized protein n=1 Tax=Astyanax mexicanus TaxID=7994 RepID=A0A3B1JZ43_ASTMX